MPTHPTATNALARASSSYLRSAMHQPIQWNEWGEEAFAKAKRENKPILLDIGAVWCHWCHVMDRESYENEDIARIINENFVAIKVDRDERPDVDSRYQAAVQAMSGQGGWPLTAFLTPDGRPFFGGTYFPPDDLWGRPGFKRVLLALAQAFSEKFDEVDESAGSVMNAISHQESFAGRAGKVDEKIIDSMVHSALQMFDRHNGGFGDKPKFPHPPALDLLIDHYSRTRNEQLHEVITLTLQKMATGGIYDQLAGGFHRYSVDERWVVPHFEKMSYDNSELLKNYVHAYQVTGNPFFAAIAQDIIRWIDEWLSDRQHGGFYASQDADYSLDDDGDYFTWTAAEAKAVLTEQEWKVASEFFDIGEVGEMHHNPQKNVLFIKKGIDEIAASSNQSEERVLQLLASAKDKMYAARLKRPTPYVDKSIYVGWNALVISAYLAASRVLKMDEPRRFAMKSLDRILAEGWSGEQKLLQHLIAYSDPQAERRPLAGVLDDYAFTINACLDAYESSSDLTYFHFAQSICDAMIERFHDSEAGGFFDTDASSDPSLLLGALTARRKPLQDSPTPAGNPAAATALLRLHNYTNAARYHHLAQGTLEAFAGIVEHFGIFAGTYGLALRMLTSPHIQVVVVGTGNMADELYGAALEAFAVNKSVLRLLDSHATPQNLPPALAETIPNIPAVKEGRQVAIICSNFACQPPISTPDELKSAIQASVHSK
jgi:uncharacterized protein YyaL (SSP411 family)